jgi:hypothetical protein
MAAGQFPEKPIHCLGASNWAKEATILAEYPIRGIDTSLPVVYGLGGHSLEAPHLSRSDLTVPFMEYDIDRRSLNWRICYDNVVRYLGWCGVDLEGGVPPEGEVP